MTVTLSEPQAAIVTVMYRLATRESTARFGQDFSLVMGGSRQRAASGRIVFAPGQTQKSLQLTPLDDVRREGDENLVIELYAPRNATLGDATRAAITIVDDDDWTAELVGPDSVAEGETATYEIRLSAPATSTQTYHVRTVNGTATGGTDFVPLSRLPVVIPRGHTMASFQIPVLQDGRQEPEERFSIVISPRLPDSAPVAPLTVTIGGSGPPPALPTITVADISVAEGDSGLTQAVVTVSLSAPATRRVTVAYATQDDTATIANADYVATAGTLAFDPGEDSKTVAVSIRGDTRVEPDEIVRFVLAAPTNATIGTGTARITITNDDDEAPPAPTPTLTVADVAVLEGNSGTSALTFTFTLSAASTLPVSVAYETRDGTATLADSDYEQASGTVVFLAGETSKTVSVNVVGDTRSEPDESFQILLTNPVNATLARNAAVGTIRDDDGSPPSAFQIDVIFPDNSLTTAQQAVFQAAAARWSEIILADLPDVTSGGRTIDDMEILATATPIDGNFGVLGRAGPTAIRSGSRGLPWRGIMEFDTADVARMMTDGSFTNVIIHEMAHVIGLGTLWQSFGLVSGIGTSNPIYTGANAVREYRTLAGSNVTSVPVENTGGQGTAGSHWRETVFRSEIMTGYLNAGLNPISRLTVGALEDLGYGVNYAAADPYTLPLVQSAARSVTTAVTRASRWPVLLAMQDARAAVETAALGISPQFSGGEAVAEPLSARAFRSLARGGA